MSHASVAASVRETHTTTNEAIAYAKRIEGYSDDPIHGLSQSERRIVDLANELSALRAAVDALMVAPKRAGLHAAAWERLRVMSAKWKVSA